MPRWSVRQFSEVRNVAHENVPWPDLLEGLRWSSSRGAFPHRQANVHPICAAFWSKPHVIALDEPTNYLDNDSVAALTKALKDFKGAVVTVSENEAFTSEISNEKWIVENGSLTVTQLRDAKAR